MARTLIVVLMIAAAAVPLRAHAQSRQGDCGYDRWPVKMLRDQDAALVGTDTVNTTVRALNALAIPEVPYPRDRRMPPHELIIYRVVAIVERIRTEDDRDWHLVLSDPDDATHTMVAEIPDSACAAGTPNGPVYSAARRELRKVPKRGLVEVTGVGFFDFIHTQRGISRNGFELHPVVRIRALSSATQ